MFNHYLKYCCAIIVILSFQNTAFAQAYKAVDDLINKQKIDVKAKEQAKVKQQRQAEQAKIKSKNCDIAKSNLTSYQSNPNGKTKNAEGEYIRIDEIERQKRMTQLKQDIQKHYQ
jgi:hypothetical protein